MRGFAKYRYLPFIVIKQVLHGDTALVMREFLARLYPRGVNVVLLQDLGERGFLGDEVVVKPGYARNFLIPTKKAVYATPVNKDKHLIERTVSRQSHFAAVLPGQLLTTRIHILGRVQEEARRLLEERRDFLIFRERVERRAVTCTRTITLEGQTLEQPIT